MGATTWIWTHGVSGYVDFPADFQEFAGPPAQVPNRPIARNASGLTLSPLLVSTHTIYLPIATPPLLDDAFMQVAGFSLLFQATDATVDSIQVFDGAKQIASFTSLGWSGSHQTRDTSNTLNLSAEVELASGLVVAIGVTFSAPPSRLGGTALAGSVVLTAVGVRLSAGETRLQRWLRTFLSVFRGQ